MKFKPVLEWLKANLWIVVFSALVILILPASFVVSRMWNKKILADQEKTATTEYNSVKSATVKYELPKFVANIEAFSLPTEPNTAITNHFKAARDTAAGQVDGVAKAADDFNRGVGPDAAAVGRSEFKPLVDGLFPKVPLTADEAKDANAARDKEQAKLNEMEDKLLGKRGNPNPFLELLKKVNAGGPENNDVLFQQLRDQRKREEEKMTQNKRRLDPDEDKRLGEMIKGARLGAYQARAKSLGVYLTPDALPLPVPDEARAARGGSSQENAELIEPYSTLPWGAIERKNLVRHKLFMHQWDLWMLSDVLSAVRVANTGPDGKLMNIENATVKRVERIALMNPEGMKTLDPKPVSADDAYATPATPPAPPTETIPGIVATDKGVSITGRTRGGWNKFYEVRKVELTCVVSSARLQDFIKSFAQTNYMTVIDLDVDSVNAWEDLEAGYYYGNEHVVRARVTVESLWFKSWLLPLMPAEVQAALGMEVPAETPADAAATPPGGG